MLFRSIRELRAVKLGNHKLLTINKNQFRGDCGPYSVAAAERIDVEEGKDLVTLKELERRDVPSIELAIAYVFAQNDMIKYP